MEQLAPAVAITIAEPWGTGERIMLSIGPEDITGFVITTTLPGGFNTLDVTFEARCVPKSDLRRNRYGHVVGWIDGRPGFVGRLFGWHEVGGYANGLTCSGYFFSGLDEHAYVSSDTTTITTGAFLSQLLISTQALVLPASNPALWVDPQTTQVPKEHSGRMPSEIVNEVLTQGDVGAQTTDLLVWDDNRALLLPRSQPATAHYVIGKDDDALHRDPDYSKARGGLSVDYTLVTVDGSGHQVSTPKTTPRGSNGLFVAENRGLYRTARLHGGTMSDAAAVAYRDAQLALLARPTVPTSVQLEGYRGLVTPEQAERPFYLVRAGEWLAVELDAQTVGLADMLPIVSTRCDVLGGTLEAAAGEPVPDFHTTQRQLRESDFAVRVGVTPTTGTRTR